MRRLLAAALLWLSFGAATNARDIIVNAGSEVFEPPGSLHWAIQEANQTDPAEPVRILFDLLPQPDERIRRLSSELPQIVHPDVSIIGPRTDDPELRVRITVSGTPDTNPLALLSLGSGLRRFVLQDIDLVGGRSDRQAACLDGLQLPASARVELLRVSMADCRQVRSSSGAALGGAAQLNGEILVDRSRFVGNHAESPEGALGGAIAMGVGQLSVLRSYFEDNHASDGASETVSFGGAVGSYVAGGTSWLAFADSAFQSNRAGNGGAVHSRAPEADVGFSAFLDNRASFGAAIQVFAPNNAIAARLTLQNSTLLANKASESGAVDVVGETTVLRMRNATFASNSAGDINTDRAGAHLSLRGGRIQEAHSSIFGPLGSEVPAGPTATASACTLSSAPGPTVVQGYNLFGDTSCALIAANSQVVGDFGLLPLELSNSGVPYLPLAADSPAVDSGHPAVPDSDDDSRCASSDIRRVLRPADGDRDGEMRCDAGAYELSLDGIFADGFES